MREASGKADRPCWKSGTGPSARGQLVEPSGPLTWPQFPWDCRSKLCALGRKREWPGRAGPLRRPSEPGRSQLVDPVGPRTWTGVARERWWTPGVPRSSASLLGQRFNKTVPQAWSRVPLDAGRKCGPSGTGLSRPERLVNPWTSNQVAIHPGQQVEPTGPCMQARMAWESWSNTQTLGAGPKSPGTAG